MRNFILKNFYKNKAIKVIIVGADKRVKIAYAIPENNIVEVDNMSFTILENKMFYSNGFPTFICSYKSAEPIDPNDLKNIHMKAEDFNNALSANIAQEIFNATNNKIDMQLVAVVLSIISVLGLVFIYITFNDVFTQIIEQLNRIPKAPLNNGGVGQ